MKQRLKVECVLIVSADVTLREIQPAFFVSDFAYLFASQGFPSLNIHPSVFTLQSSNSCTSLSLAMASRVFQ